MAEKTGKCMCGAISFTARGSLDRFNICACDMCRRITGSQFFSVWLNMSELDLSGADNIRTLQSSDWAERAFCGNCGSVLWYRPTDGAEGVGLSLGLFDDVTGLVGDNHWYTDKAICQTVTLPPAHTLTEAETEAQYNGGTD
ncbi:GFA family protein [Pseudohalocynthiibacter aestuariivivens]|uniref:GFA family protein n=1 Tax=Roseovarius pelagicus TaxID=2980108 RepID=A0ABY6DD81_9RHOB|nr:MULTISPECIES: GFA family protein [Rhodobacterales]QIE46248.1 GFA family protein [Pseudohalocynthiibacter aestuariivivens]UXX81785.1 GFA family protein [Roseovarius pelagicus]